ncbi:HpcH/HpaI aldolase family protein [Pseudooceanicola aestuarii]|uniref:HpcH/HpaI aldolase family protein n=1 Tax=Pseudooceanicola aestuarii TaxID=2697319 RepID=UPI0013D74981|nr:HpcH/HpaI aldolase/citrate lyase family protein [Pseudooceanicola aestuarii]
MDMPKNAFKAALAAGQRQVGMWCTLPDPGVVELLAGCGYDWLLLDTEHAPNDAAGTQPLMQAAAPYPVSTIVRVGWNDPVEIKRVLDCGAQTIMVPYVQNAQEARAAVAAAHYPPNGSRGVAGATRASRYGAVTDYIARAAQETCVLVQVESVEATARIEEIAKVPGVDGIFVGPADLSASMGLTGQTGHPKVQEAVLDALRRITAAGKPAGILSLDRDFMSRALDAGALFAAIDLDAALLRRAAVARRGEVG